MKNLLPDYVDGDLSALCVWPDQIRHWYKYRWTSSLHFIDTPDEACTFEYSSKVNKVGHDSREFNQDAEVILFLLQGTVMILME